MSLDEFLERQDRIYAAFRDTATLRRQGTIPNLRSAAGVIVALHHDDGVNQSVATISSGLSQIIPCVTYSPSTVHTTLVVYDAKAQSEPDAGLLSRLTADLIRHRANWRRPVIRYGELLANEDSVIAAGVPDEAFVQMVEQIRLSTAHYDVSVRPTWGAHMTVARFTRGVSPQLAQHLLEYLRSEVLADSSPVALDVGRFTFAHGEFSYDVYDRLRL
ncbi:MAG: hypothetical protein ABIH41_05380 [Nanoarchaeota archaeon]